MAELSDSQIAHIYSEAETRAKAWHMPDDTLQPEVEEILPEYFSEEEDPGEELEDENSQMIQNSGGEEYKEDESLFEGFQDAPFKEAPPQEEDGAESEDEDDEENLSQDEIEAMITEMQGGSTEKTGTDESPETASVPEEESEEDDEDRNLSRDEIESLLANASAGEGPRESDEEDSVWEESYTPLGQSSNQDNGSLSVGGGTSASAKNQDTEFEVVINDGSGATDEDSETYLEVGSNEIESSDTDEFAGEQGTSDEESQEDQDFGEFSSGEVEGEADETYIEITGDDAGKEGGGADELMTADDIEALLTGEDAEEENDSDDGSEEETTSDTEMEVEIGSTEESSPEELIEEDPETSENRDINLDSMFDESEDILANEGDETDLLSQDEFESEDELDSEESDPDSSDEDGEQSADIISEDEEVPDEPAVEPEEQEVESTDESESDAEGSEENEPSEETEEPSETAEEETTEVEQPEESEAEGEPPEKQESSEAEDDQMMSKEELSAMLRQEEQEEDAEKSLEELSQHTEEITKRLDGLEEQEMQNQSQFNPPTVDDSSESANNSKEKVAALLIMLQKNLKFVVPSVIGLIAIALAFFLYPMLQSKQEPIIELAHASEAWKWERNLDATSSVKYRIYAPGTMVTLSSLGGLKLSELEKVNGAPLKEYYEELERNHEIMRFRLLGEVKYFEKRTDKDVSMLHYDYFYRDIEGKNHLKRSAYFSVSELLLKMEFTSISEDSDLTSSESEVSQNLNQIFMDVFGITNLKYLPEHLIGDDKENFETNIQYLAQRAILLDK